MSWLQRLDKDIRTHRMWTVGIYKTRRRLHFIWFYLERMSLTLWWVRHNLLGVQRWGQLACPLGLHVVRTYSYSSVNICTVYISFCTARSNHIFLITCHVDLRLEILILYAYELSVICPISSLHEEIIAIPYCISFHTQFRGRFYGLTAGPFANSIEWHVIDWLYVLKEKT